MLNGDSSLHPHADVRPAEAYIYAHSEFNSLFVLARQVFAPSVVGYPPATMGKPERLPADTLVSERIMARILDVDPKFWNDILDKEIEESGR